jgi:DNA-binding response OmpR family regulator
MILPVDDQAAVRAVISRGLKVHGFDVVQAADGKEAVEVFRRQHREIDVVLLDLNMPGLSGLQTLAALRAIDPGFRCCLMTGDGGEYSEADLQGLGVGGVISKPFALAKVAAHLRRLLARPRTL